MAEGTFGRSVTHTPRREAGTTRRATKSQVQHWGWDMMEQENMAQVMAEARTTSDDADVENRVWWKGRSKETSNK